jgi:hypothetical protein
MTIAEKLQEAVKSLEKRKKELELLEGESDNRELLEEIGTKLDKIQKTFKQQEYPEPLESVKVDNLSEIKIPEVKSVSVKKPNWFKQFNLPDLINSIGELFDNLLNREFKSNLDQYRSAKNAIAVRISNGKSFIESFSAGVATGVSSIEFPNWLAREDTQQEINDKLDTYSLNDTRDHNTDSDITYLGKEDKQGEWLFVRIDKSDGAEFRYATVLNNESVSNYSDALNSRESLNYGTYSQAF